ncbi:MAG: hypothetical protein N2V76_08355 [Methanophagales archaeon]|nr:hypothetical protein [Methanophagales archaeon]
MKEEGNKNKKIKNTLDLLITNFPTYTETLGIDLKEPSGRFRWFLASILFGARINEKIAIQTYKAFERHEIDSPDKVIAAGWDELVKILDEGGYVRYDFSTATKLLEIAHRIKDKYGTLDNIYEQSTSTEDLECRLIEFKGIGRVTVQIFLRELRGIWQINPVVSNSARIAAEHLGIDLSQFSASGELLAKIEAALVKLFIRYCKRQRCDKCPLRIVCKAAG